MRTRAIVTALLAVVFAFALSTPALANTFSLSVAAGTEVVMGDTQAVVPVTVANSASSSRDIRSITFNANTARYSFNAHTVPPDGWCISSVSADSISFALTQGGGSCSTGSSASEIAPGASLLFNIGVTPASAAADSTDSFSSAAVVAQSGFALSGALPTWTRRSLEAGLAAAPSSTGAGGQITLVMQVINRSTAVLTGIGSTPSPPTASPLIATMTAGPYYASTLLTASLTASATTVSVSSTTEFPSSGTVRVGSEDICYSGKTATTLTGATRGCNSSTASAHSSGALVYGKDSFSLSPGQSRSITWIYSANSTGSVYFTARATNSAGSARSSSASSNTVVIGSFTASLALSPESIISGQSFQVEMLVANNGSTALIDIAPSSLTPCAGGAVETLASGPSPSGISSLAPGSSGVFAWSYTATGSIGQAYCLSGSASASGPVSTGSAASNTGRISSYSVTVAPSVVPSAQANPSITWTVHNGGGCGIRDVDIAIPAGWTCSSVTAPAGWSGSCGAAASLSSGGAASDINSGSTGSFTVAFTAAETVTSDKVVSFPVTVSARGCGGAANTLGSFVTVSANAIVLSHSPAGPVYADGSSFYTMTATLTSGGSPLSGKTVAFSTTSGILSASSALTDSSGQASVTLTSPSSTVDTSATVTASYLGASSTDLVSFTGWTGPNLQYWGALTPTSADCGSSYSFTLKVKNISAVADMNLTKLSYFAFNDAASGGGAEFLAYLNAATTVARGATVTLTFGSPTSAGGGGGVALSSGFVAGTYQPIANASPPPESGLFLANGGVNDQRRSVTDSLTVAGPCGAVKVRVIDWHEMR